MSRRIIDNILYVNGYALCRRLASGDSPCRQVLPRRYSFVLCSAAAKTSQASFSIFFQRQQLSYRGAQDQGGHGTEVAGRRSSGAKHRGKKRWVVCGVTERALKIKRSCRVFYCDADNELLDAFFRKKMKHLG